MGSSRFQAAGSSGGCNKDEGVTTAPT